MGDLAAKNIFLSIKRLNDEVCKRKLMEEKPGWQVGGILLGTITPVSESAADDVVKRIRLCAFAGFVMSD